MDTKLNDTAYELERSLSEAATLAEGALQLMGDAAGRYDGDKRHHAYRVLMGRVLAEVANAADAFEAVQIALQEQL